MTFLDAAGLHALLREIGGWRADAACRNVVTDPDRDPFFPTVHNSGRYHRAQALEYCDRCPVRAECLEAGMNERDGIWGGLDPKQRRRLARKGGR